MSKNYRLTGLLAAVVCLMGCGGDSGDYSKYVSLGDYKDLSAELVVEKVTDEDLEEYEKEQLYDYVSYKEVNGPAEEGQLVEVSLLAKDGEETVYDFVEDGYELIIGQQEFGSEVDAALIGGSAGDVLDFSVSYHDDFEDMELAGKEIGYHIEIRKVSDVVYPELTNEFVKENLGEQSAEAWRDALTEELQAENQADAIEDVRYDLVKQVIDSAQISGYPKDLYNQKREAVEADYQSYADMFGCSLDEIYKMLDVDEKQLEQEYLDETYRAMVLAMIRQQENLTLSDEQQQEKLEEFAKEYDYDSVEELLEDYDEENMKQYFLDEMTIDFLEEHANITASGV